MLSIHDAPFVFWYFAVLAVVLGAALGSFCHCTAYRIVRGQAFTSGHSRCPQCGHELHWADLVPIVSWLALRGRCRYCKAKIPPRYFLAECAFAALTLACLLRFDLTVLGLRNLVFSACLFILAMVDAESKLIPDKCLLAAFFAWAAALPFLGEGVSVVLPQLLAAVGYGGGLLCISLAFDKIFQKESMGGGDIKLFAVAALYLGPVGTLLALLLSCLFGLAFAVAAKKGNKQFPFGPSIALAVGVVLFYGQGPINWYLGLLGLA